MKKSIIILLAAALIFVAVGCGSNNAVVTTNKIENSNVSDNTENKSAAEPSDNSNVTAPNDFEFASKNEAFDAMVKYRDTYVEMLIQKSEDADSNMMLATATDDEIKQIMYDWAIGIRDDLNIYYSNLELYVCGYLRAISKDTSEYEDDLKKLREFLEVGVNGDPLYENVYYNYTWKFFDRLYDIDNGELDEFGTKIDEAFTEIATFMYNETEPIKDRINYIEEQFEKGNTDIDKYLK